MPETTNKGTRLAKVAKEINLGIDSVAEHLRKKGFEVEARPTTRITAEMYNLLLKDFNSDIVLKQRAEQVSIGQKKREKLSIDSGKEKNQAKQEEVESVQQVEKLTEELIQSTKEDVAVEDIAVEETPSISNADQTVSDSEKTISSDVSNDAPPIVEEQPQTPVVEENNEDEKVSIEFINDPVESPVEPEPVQDVVVPVTQEEVQEPKVVQPEPEVVVSNEEKTVPQEKKVQEQTPEAETPVENPIATPETPPVQEKTESKKTEPTIEKVEVSLDGPTVVGKIDLGRKDTKKKRSPKGRNNPPKPKKDKPKQQKQEPKKPAPKPKPKAEEPKKEKKRTPKEIAAAKLAQDNPPTVDLRRPAPVLEGPKVLGKIELPTEESKKKKKKGQRTRITRTTRSRNSSGNKSTSGNNSSGNNNNSGGNRSGGGRGGNNNSNNNNRNRNNNNNRGNNRGRGRGNKRVIEKPTEVSQKEIKEKIKETMAKLSANTKSNRSKTRRDKRAVMAEKAAQRELAQKEDENILHVTEFITVSELASLMEINPAEIISACMTLGTFVSINQRLDAEIIDLMGEEFGYDIKFIKVSEEEEEEEIVDAPEDLLERAPIVTIMGHVDHGKTSLLDYVRKANVIGGEMGGITQHIGAYEVMTESGKSITFLDTPGHEAFTAMRARGAKVTDIAVIVISADDAVMPQTKEAISHAQAAGVPIIFAFNKMDKDGANADRIRQQLSSMNLLVEEWGGKYQSEEISAKHGTNVDNLLEKILLEAEMLELKANPKRKAIGSVVEAELDKGRGYITTLLVSTGTLKVGDMIVAGANYGKVKAMFDERNQRVNEAGPAQPVLVLGLNGAPQAGEKFKVYESEQEAKEVANRREQILREQGRRTRKHITLDEIGRRLALDSFKELNLIVKGDVDGSVEALADSLLKLSKEEIQVNVIHKSVGQISESDVLLATASDAIIVGFQVRPSLNARRLAEKEDIEIRLYSIIYAAIEEIQSAMEGMLEPTIEEKIVCNIEVRDVFKISKVGTIAGCLVQEGKINRNTKIRLVRDGIVKYSGELASLKRFKDDAKEVSSGMECGLNIKNYNDIKVGDIIEGYEEIEIKRTLS